MKGKHAALVIGFGGPPPGKGPDADADGPAPGMRKGPAADHMLRVAAGDIMAAVEAKDVDRLMDGLRAAHMALDDDSAT